MKPDRLLVEIAANVCARENIDLATLDARSQRGLVFYWCSTYGKVYLWTDLLIMPRRSRCGHCKENVKLYTNSNKFGKLHCNILYRLLDMGVLGPEVEEKRDRRTNGDIY
jgi:hypothetical protein